MPTVTPVSNPPVSRWQRGVAVSVMATVIGFGVTVAILQCTRTDLSWTQATLSL